MSDPKSPSGPPQPHHDAGSWGKLIDSLDLASVFVVLGSWIGASHRSRIAVEDVWQETLWSAWRDRHQHTWVNLMAFRAWLLGIARHRADDACRRAQRQKRGGGKAAAPFSDLASQESVSRHLPPQSTTPSRVVGHRERAAIMERALERLDPPLRQVVHLRLFEELPTQAVARQLGIPLSTAKERLVRGVQRYRELLSSMLPTDSVSGQSQAPP